MFEWVALHDHLSKDERLCGDELGYKGPSKGFPNLQIKLNNLI